ncbi:MAG: SusC/RagA family TonB-linked outer membrane protein [Cyclobacteriaceae bacterium]|nr:SusC/RagA family TonB-linked outer membrane protein [Cyclobacteriaceae bacterium]
MKVKILAKPWKFKFLILHLIIFTAVIAKYSDALAQQQVSGKVVSATDNTALPGVSVFIKGTTRGTTTDLDGNYYIKVNPEETLVFSFVGFNTEEIEVGSQTVINVSLVEDVSTLDEIIVTGYSQKSQKELSASVVSLGIDDVKNVTSSNVENMLQGKVAGLTVNTSTGQPGAAPDIRLRGITSINADRSPLIVVDGMIGGNFVPSDVENITVLKDAAAIGLYGSRGAAGVLVVTTKRAKDNTNEIHFGSSFGIKEASMGKFKMMSGSELYDTQEIMWGTDRLGFLANRPQELRDQNFNWIDAGFRKATIQNYNFAVRGNASKVSYSFNIDYFDEEGTFINTDFQRLNMRGGISFSASDVFSLSTDVNAQFNQDHQSHYSWFEDAFYSLPWDDPYNEDGTTKFVNSSSFTGKWYGQFRRNFVNSAKYNSLGSKGMNLVWSTRLLFNITDWLSLETRVRVSGSNSRYDQYYSPLTHEGIQMNGIVYADQVSNRSILYTNFIRLNKSFGDHALTAFLAQEGASDQTNSLGVEVSNLAPTIKVPVGASSYNDVSGAFAQFSSLSFISEIDYGFKSKYFATLVYRADGSSIFAPDSRWGAFPSASVAWLVSEEDFLSSSVIKLLKLRLSYGLVGNDGLGTLGGPQPYEYYPLYDISTQYDGQPAGIPANPENKQLGWETSTIANIGVDFGLFNSDLLFTIDVYEKKVDNMLFKNPLAYSQGFESRWENIGSMVNKGIEFSVDYKKSFGDWTYNGNFNISYNQNEMTYISEVSDEQYISSGPVFQINKVGLPAFTWYMPKWLGVNPDNGAPVWEQILPDGTATETSDYNLATIQPISSAIPKISGGMTSSISYKGLTLSFLLTYQLGNEIYNSTREFVDSDGANVGINMMELQDGWTRWLKPGDIATHPILTKGDNDGSHFTSSRYIEKGDYMRIRNISLSYNLPQLVLGWAKIKSASIGASVDNLLTFTKFSGMDPDINMTLGAFELPGLSFLKYPLSKQYNVQLNINF